MSGHRVDKGLEIGNRAWQLVMREGVSLTEAARSLGITPLRVATIVISLARKRLAALEEAAQPRHCLTSEAFRHS